MKAPNNLIWSIAVVTAFACTLSADPLILTTAGASQGFALSVFASGFAVSSSGVGPDGIAFLSSGSVLTTDWAAGGVQVFPSDTDGQDAAAVPYAQTYGSNNAQSIALAAGNLYLSQAVSDDLLEINSNGTLESFATSIPGGAEQLWEDPLTGDLLVGSFGNGIYQFNPSTLALSLLASAPGTDGVALSNDGQTVYAALYGGEVEGFDVSTGEEVYNSGPIAGTPIGVVQGNGALANDLFVNTLTGGLIEVDLTTHAQTLIATGATGGAFVYIDPNNGSLMVTESDTIYRLTPAAGGSFGPEQSATTPEPGSLLLLGSGLAALAKLIRRRRAA